MAAVLTLDSTPSEAESFPFLLPVAGEELPADEGDSGVRGGLESMDIDRITVKAGTTAMTPRRTPPPIGYHAPGTLYSAAAFGAAQVPAHLLSPVSKTVFT